MIEQFPVRCSDTRPHRPAALGGTVNGVRHRRTPSAVVGRRTTADVASRRQPCHPMNSAGRPKASVGPEGRTDRSNKSPEAATERYNKHADRRTDRTFDSWWSALEARGGRCGGGGGVVKDAQEHGIRLWAVRQRARAIDEPRNRPRSTRPAKSSRTDRVLTRGTAAAACESRRSAADVGRPSHTAPRWFVPTWRPSTNARPCTDPPRGTLESIAQNQSSYQ